jgi:hypothetical protein
VSLPFSPHASLIFNLLVIKEPDLVTKHNLHVETSGWRRRRGTYQPRYLLVTWTSVHVRESGTNSNPTPKDNLHYPLRTLVLTWITR